MINPFDPMSDPVVLAEWAARERHFEKSVRFAVITFIALVLLGVIAGWVFL